MKRVALYEFGRQDFVSNSIPIKILVPSKAKANPKANAEKTPTSDFLGNPSPSLIFP